MDGDSPWLATSKSGVAREGVGMGISRDGPSGSVTFCRKETQSQPQCLSSVQYQHHKTCTTQRRMF